MSDTYFSFIPADPQYVPPENVQARMRQVVHQALPESTYVDIKVTDQATFLDAGENFESISCPRCGSELEDSWWVTNMNTAYETGFVHLGVKTPCCGADTSLNDLDYYFPQGFARFAIEVLGPNVYHPSRELVSRLTHLLGQPVRVIQTRR